MNLLIIHSEVVVILLLVNHKLSNIVFVRLLCAIVSEIWSDLGMFYLLFHVTN